MIYPSIDKKHNYSLVYVYVKSVGSIPFHINIELMHPCAKQIQSGPLLGPPKCWKMSPKFKMQGHPQFFLMPVFLYKDILSSSIFNEILLIVSLNFAERYLKYRYIQKLGRNTCVFVSYFCHFQSKLRLEGSLCSLSLD